jgi:1-acyl-sn-glycerol-3-phosphate acyltransferase
VPDGRSELIPGAFNPRFQRVFAWYAKRLFRKRFYAVRAAPGSVALLESVRALPTPVILGFNHCSWWDPMIGFHLHGQLLTGRTPCSPIDATQLRRFQFFRKLGMFGIDPDDPMSLRAMARYVGERFAQDERPLLMLTPQGRFVDPRVPVEVRPGIGLVAMQHPQARVLVVAVEYAFWTEQRPEVFFRVESVDPPADARSVRAWTEAVEAAMRRNAAALADLVIARDPARLETVSGGGEASIHPLYDLLLRATGRGTAIEVAHRARATEAPR